MKKYSLAWLGSMPVAACLLMGNLAQAEQRSFTPQAGTWVVSAEVNGKPGRGLAIDVQEDTFFMQVYNYKANGEATFHTALGELKGNTVTAPLTHYEGGHYFGSGPLTAHEAGNAGDVTITFTSGLRGTVQFPGEETVAIERFLAGSSDDAFSPGNATAMRDGQNARWLAVDGDSIAVIWGSKLLKTAEGKYQLKLSPITYKPFFLGSNEPLFLGKNLTYDCQYSGSGAQGYDCTRSDSQAPANFMPKISFRYAAADVTGTVITDASTGKTIRLMGNMLANGAVPGSVIPGQCISTTLQTFVPGDNCNGSRMPVNGTWVVADELNGKPGRGISLDVQNNIAVLQIFDYLNTGASTFHMGSGSYGQSSMDIDLFRYGGGRYFGGPARSGSVVEDAGAVQIDLQGAPSLAEAMIQFPGEGPKKMVRMGLTSQSSPEESLLGDWHMIFRGEKSGSILTTVSLDRVVDSVVSNKSGNVKCLFQSVAERQVSCKFYSSGAAPQEMGSVSFVYNGTSPASGSVIKIKDRKGNLLGV
ncbi:hypothetical protein [Comamonas odontotermitis]|uniref:hypothetical protein n=1 Tax=Comamonas odontotermitis TaxID=379895 RepID=UPI0037530134